MVTPTSTRRRYAESGKGKLMAMQTKSWCMTFGGAVIADTLKKPMIRIYSLVFAHLAEEP